jgi:translation initiation factor IF-2
MRVYELAREVGLPNKELIAKIRALGFNVNNHMSSLSAEDADKVKRSLKGGGPAKAPESKDGTKRLRKTVLRRRSKSSNKTEVIEVKTPAKREAEAKEEEPKVAKPVTRRKAAAKPAEVETKAEPAEVEAKPEPAPEAKAPAPKEVEVAPAAEPKPVEEARPAEVAKPAARSTRAKTLVVEGPKTVDLPGHEKKPEPKPVVVEEAKPKTRPAGPKTMQQVVGGAQERFQAELERARQQAAAREESRREAAAKRQAEKEPVNVAARPDGRPEVGTIIDLPVTRIKITERPAGGRTAPGGGARGRFAQQNRGGRGRRDVRRKTKPKGQGKQTQITTPAEHKRVVRIEETTTVADLGRSMGIKAQELLKKLWNMGMVGVTINASIDFETAQLLAVEFGYDVQNVAFKEDDVFVSSPDKEEDMVVRAPVVTVMGHVDHGKTSLLDYIRSSKVASGESGGITQHVGAYKVNAGDTYGDIVFIDTPGHAAFTEMRARGAQCTDIVILVVAADDGVMPQTAEAVKHAKDANVTILVAVNKSDLPGANPERVRQQLADHGLIPEEWGGDTIYVDVSALTGDGIDKLLESVTLNAEVMELRANPNKPAMGTVIEARLDRSRGPISTVLVREGTLHQGDIVVVGEHMGKVRAMMDHAGNIIEEAGPSTPVELLGIDGVPTAGDVLNATEDEKRAKQVVESRRQQRRKKELASSGKVSIENLMDKIQSGNKAEVLKVVLKADVQGSAEALKDALVKLSTPKVEVDVISAGVGAITETDVNLANAGNAIIVGFNVRTAGKAAKLADREGVDIKIYDVIYDALDDVRIAMAGLLAPIHRKVEQGTLEVRDTFTIPRKGVVAGCMVTSGLVNRKSLLRVIREDKQVYEGKVSSLRRFKDEAQEVKDGFECGLMVDGFNDLQVGDIIQSYEIVEEAATL